MRITFSKNSWDDYISWQKDDKKLLKKIGPEELIENIDLFTKFLTMRY